MRTVVAHLRARRDEQEGFTLIELMVVVLIIAILIAIAIPTFLGARSKAQDRAAQSSLRNALTAAKTIYTDSQDYTQAGTSALGAVEPSLSYEVAGTTSSGPKDVSVSNVSSSVIVMAAKSASGTCFAIKDDLSAGTSYARVSGSCTGQQAAGASFGSSW